MAAVKGGGARPGGLDDVARGERASVRHRADGAAPLGGSNRLLTVDELAAYLGVPKKTVYGCWPSAAAGTAGAASLRGNLTRPGTAACGVASHLHGAPTRYLRTCTQIAYPGRMPQQAHVAAPPPPELGAGRPVRRLSRGMTSREDIVLAAVKVVSAGGYEQMSIRSLAAELGVAPISLYRHICDKDDLLDEVVDRLLAAAWRPSAAGDDWQAWVIEAAARLRRFLVTQPAALHVYLGHPVVSVAATERMDAMMDVLRRAGADEQTARRAYGAPCTRTPSASPRSKPPGPAGTPVARRRPAVSPRTPLPGSSRTACATCATESACTPEQA